MPADLAADFAALEAADARANAHHEFIPRIAWPEGVRMAVNVTLDCGGAALVARITRQSAAALELTPGRDVFAVIKAVSVSGPSTEPR